MLLFDESNNWNTERRARALELMDKYIAKNAKPSSYITTWTRHGAPKKATALKTYCAKYHLCGGFVCYAESEDELLLSADGFSEDIHDPCWKLLREVPG